MLPCHPGADKSRAAVVLAVTQASRFPHSPRNPETRVTEECEVESGSGEEAVEAGIRLSLSWQNVKPLDPPPRTRKYRILKVLLWGGNHVMRWQLQHGLAPSAFALVETVGRCTGQPRQTCVGNGLMGDTFWVVAAHGQQADWVRNISKEPQARVLVNGRWRRGTATLMPEDDPGQRSRTLPFQWDAAIGRVIATRPLTVRIDLEREADSARSPASGPRAE